MLRLGLPLVLAALLAGCQMMPSLRADIAPRPVRASIAAFSMDGRIAAHQGEQHHYANIAWHHTPADDDIVLTTPLGQGVAELSRAADGARLVTADRRTVVAPDWESLSSQIFGFALPLEGMPRWLLGDVAPSSRDDRGRPLAAVVDGWDIRYLDYESAAAGALPVLIELRRDDIELRLKVDAWEMK